MFAITLLRKRLCLYVYNAVAISRTKRSFTLDFLDYNVTIANSHFLKLVYASLCGLKNRYFHCNFSQHVFNVIQISVVSLVVSRVRSISSIMPSQLNDSRKVKRAVNEIDKFRQVSLFCRVQFWLLVRDIFWNSSQSWSHKCNLLYQCLLIVFKQGVLGRL